MVLTVDVLQVSSLLVLALQDYSTSDWQADTERSIVCILSQASDGVVNTCWCQTQAFDLEHIPITL